MMISVVIVAASAPLSRMGHTVIFPQLLCRYVPLYREFKIWDSVIRTILKKSGREYAKSSAPRIRVDIGLFALAIHIYTGRLVIYAVAQYTGELPCLATYIEITAIDILTRKATLARKGLVAL